MIEKRTPGPAGNAPLGKQLTASPILVSVVSPAFTGIGQSSNASTKIILFIGPAFSLSDPGTLPHHREPREVFHGLGTRDPPDGDTIGYVIVLALGPSV